VRIPAETDQRCPGEYQEHRAQHESLSIGALSIVKRAQYHRPYAGADGKHTENDAVDGAVVAAAEIAGDEERQQVVLDPRGKTDHDNREHRVGVANADEAENPATTGGTQQQDEAHQWRPEAIDQPPAEYPADNQRNANQRSDFDDRFGGKSMRAQDVFEVGNGRAVGKGDRHERYEQYPERPVGDRLPDRQAGRLQGLDIRSLRRESSRRFSWNTPQQHRRPDQNGHQADQHNGIAPAHKGDGEACKGLDDHGADAGAGQGNPERQTASPVEGVTDDVGEGNRSCANAGNGNQGPAGEVLHQRTAGNRQRHVGQTKTDQRHRGDVARAGTVDPATDRGTQHQDDNRGQKQAAHDAAKGPAELLGHDRREDPDAEKREGRKAKARRNGNAREDAPAGPKFPIVPILLAVSPHVR